MFSKRKKNTVLNTIGCLIMLILTGGCVEHEYRDYKSIGMDLLDGVLLISIQSRVIPMDEVNRKVEKGAPYSLAFTFHRDISRKFVKMEVVDLIISGVETKNTIRFDKLETTRIIDFSKINIRDQRLEAITGTGIPVESGIIYEPLHIRAKIRIFDSEYNYTEEPLEIHLDTEYRREIRSELFDKWMSV